MGDESIRDFAEHHVRYMYSYLPSYRHTAFTALARGVTVVISPDENSKSNEFSSQPSRIAPPSDISIPGRKAAHTKHIPFFFPRLSSSTGSEMRFPRLPYSLAALALGSLLTRADMGSYFEFVQPTTGTEWINGEVHPIIWEKGLLDGVGMFDLELARLSQDGIIKAALNVPANAHYMNVLVQDVPAADDYYLLFINSTHGGMYAISPRFTVLEAGSSIQNTSASAEPAVATATTLTISGGPNPTAVFATTFPAIDSGVQAWRLDSTARRSMLGIMCAAAAVVLGAAWTVL
ncbi:hypothetical protein ACEPAH_2298 [Sanghuangporus vaninii]